MIEIKNATVAYPNFGSGTTSLKEFVIGLVQRRQSSPRETNLAIDSVSLTVAKGERVGIIGRNGAGKSTVLRLISKVMVPTSGEVNVAGVVHPLIELGAGFNVEFTGRENIYLNGAMLGMTKKNLAVWESEIVEFAGIGSAIDKPIKTYSSGMIARLGFAIATQVTPDILVLDEMLSAGDVDFVGKARSRMEQRISGSQCLVLASHDLRLIQGLCTRVVVLDQGRKVYDGDVAGGVETYLNPRTGENNG